MATHSYVLAWRIPGAAEPGGLPSVGSGRVGLKRLSSSSSISITSFLQSTVCVLVHTQSCPALATSWTVAHQLLCPWDSPGNKLEWVTISFSNA